MRNKPVWLHWGTYDTWKPKRGDEDVTFLTNKLQADVTLVERATYHVWPSIFLGLGETYDGYGALLTNLWGKFGLSLNAYTTDWASQGVLRQFDQREFIDAYIPWEFHGLNERGFVYYPNNCKTAGSNCKVHMLLHGC